MAAPPSLLVSSTLLPLCRLTLRLLATFLPMPKLLIPAFHCSPAPGTGFSGVSPTSVVNCPSSHSRAHTHHSSSSPHLHAARAARPHLPSSAAAPWERRWDGGTGAMDDFDGDPDEEDDE